MQRVKLLIEYLGTDYVGWQAQKNGKSIQEEIESALSEIFKKRIKLFVAGRTDAGVHALGQVAHFDLEASKIEEKKIYYAINFFLKKNKNKITIIDSEFVDKTFHSRFSVKQKVYLYKILNRKTPSYIFEDRAWFIPEKLNLIKIKQASRYLIGKYDFNAFRSIDCQAQSSVRTIDEIVLTENEDFIELRVFGKSFMHNQVRIIVGTLINVGKEIIKESYMQQILDSKERKNAGPTAPASGLYLEKIKY